MSELKTLKDIDCVHCNDKCDNFKCDAYTLHKSHAVSVENLRQKAIKWIKLLRSDKFYDLDLKNIEFSDPTDIVPWIKYFFNISEEDLK